MSLAKGRRGHRHWGLALTGLAVVGLVREFISATDFPTADPIHIVDASVLALLRAQPGLHRALAPDYELRVPLELVDDPENRRIYGTSIDMREAIAERAIHIQQKGPRLAIHADRRNPRAGAIPWLLHGTLDVPIFPLIGLLSVGVVLSLARTKANE